MPESVQRWPWDDSYPRVFETYWKKFLPLTPIMRGLEVTIMETAATFPSHEDMLTKFQGYIAGVLGINTVGSSSGPVLQTTELQIQLCTRLLNVITQGYYMKQLQGQSFSLSSVQGIASSEIEDGFFHDMPNFLPGSHPASVKDNRAGLCNAIGAAVYEGLVLNQGLA
jgi:hypothetical protein